MIAWMPRAGRLAALALTLLATAALPPGSPLRVAAPKPQPVYAGVDHLFIDERDPGAIVARPDVGQRVQPSPAPVFRRGGTYVPVLLYHYIRYPPPGDRLGFGLSVPPPMFHQQMQYLAANGFHVISLHEAVQAVLGRGRLPSRPIVLTFDDGYADFYYAAVPELRLWGFTATSFVVTGRVGWAGYMTWSQISAIDAMGFTVGAHTVDHWALAGLSYAQARWEMQQSRDTLATVLGHPILDFAYPYGSFNATDIALARQLGFECAVSTIASPWHWPDELYYMYRLRIGGGFTMYDFARWIGGPAYRPGVTATPPPPAATPTPNATPAPTPTPTPTPAAPSPSPSPVSPSPSK